MCDGLKKKKKSEWWPRLLIRIAITTLKGNARMFKFTKKKANFDAFESFCKIFFLLLKERGRITVAFFIIFLFFIKFCKLN
jgi:hypothetical protein